MRHQDENLQRLDDDIDILKAYLKTEHAPKAAVEALEDLTVEQHVGWKKARVRLDHRFRRLTRSCPIERRRAAHPERPAATNIGKVAALDDGVAAFNPTKRTKRKTIIRVHP